MNNLLAIHGREYAWLYDFLTRLYVGEEEITREDHDSISALLERTACCERCERIHNEHVIEEAGYEKKGGVHV